MEEEEIEEGAGQEALVGEAEAEVESVNCTPILLSRQSLRNCDHVPR